MTPLAGAGLAGPGLVGPGLARPGLAGDCGVAVIGAGLLSGAAGDVGRSLGGMLANDASFVASHK